MSKVLIPNSFREYVQIVDLPKFEDSRGSLAFIEGSKHVPFSFKRAYFLYDVQRGSCRGGHAHKVLKQLIIAAAGSFDIILDNGTEKLNIHLSCPHIAIYLKSCVWRELSNFSYAATCLVLASEYYDEADYIRNYLDFKSYVRAN